MLIDRLYTDHGIGMTPVYGKALAFARTQAPSVVCIPQGQPWRNGRLERWHYTLQREFFYRERPTKIDECLESLRDYINWYNLERPHQGIADQPLPLYCPMNRSRPIGTISRYPKPMDTQG